MWPSHGQAGSGEGAWQPRGSGEGAWQPRSSGGAFASQYVASHLGDSADSQTGSGEAPRLINLLTLLEAELLF